MKKLILAVSMSLWVGACDVDTTNTNQHRVTPQLQQEDLGLASARVQGDDLQQIYLKYESRVEAAGDGELFDIIADLEIFALDEKRLRDPKVNTQGALSRDYQRVIDLYLYALMRSVKNNPGSNTLEGHLEKFRQTIEKDCQLTVRSCQNAPVFKGAYGASVLAHIYKKRFSNLSRNQKKIQDLKNELFRLYILKEMDNSVSNLVSDIFIKFSTVFFAQVGTSAITDKQFLEYLKDLQQTMTQRSREAVNTSSCEIFDVINPLDVRAVGDLNRNFIEQLSVYYYKCKSSGEILNTITGQEKAKIVMAKKERDQDVEAPWVSDSTNFHQRFGALETEFSGLLSSFSADRPLSLAAVHVLDLIFYDRASHGEVGSLLDKFSQDDLLTLINSVETYSKVHFLYRMLQTFRFFDGALQGSYAESQTVNQEFVQKTYDELFANVGDSWVDFKENTSQLRGFLSEVYLRLNAPNQQQAASLYADLKDRKLDLVSMNEMINLAVTFPIVLATNYVAGLGGGGTMSIRVNWLQGVDNTINIPTKDSLNHFFQAHSRNSLQLLNFGYLSFDPNEYERNAGLALAIQSRFFDVVNLDLGRNNKGMAHNLELFFAKYIEDNKLAAESAKKEITNLNKVSESHWDKVVQICKNPITGSRQIDLKKLYTHFYLESKHANGSTAKEDLAHANSVMELKEKIGALNTEIRRLKRTYLVTTEALSATRQTDAVLTSKLHGLFAPHFRIAGALHAFSSKLLEKIDGGVVRCLNELTQMEQFQKNLLQRKAVAYFAEIHASMGLLQTDVPASATPAELEAILAPIVEASEDTFLQTVWKKVEDSSLLQTVYEDLGLTGSDLLSRVLNLIQSPHNMNRNFGYPIEGMVVRADSLSARSNFLGPRGFFNKRLIRISQFDQQMRVRHELMNLSATTRQLRKYFSVSSSILSDISDKSDGDRKVELNPNLDVRIENFKSYLEDLGSSEREATIYMAPRDVFVRYALEALYGNNRSGDHFFNWNSTVSRHTFASWAFRSTLTLYKDGPFVFPDLVNQAIEGDSLADTREDDNASKAPQSGGTNNSAMAGKSDFSCALDRPFDVFTTPEGCFALEVSASQVIDEFVDRADFYFRGDRELYPLAAGVQESDEGVDSPLQSLIDSSFFGSRYIEFYSPTDILKYFKYYGFLEEPSQWTWFDQFVAREFTTQSARDGEGQSVNINYLRGTRSFVSYLEQKKKSRHGEFLLPMGDVTDRILRKYYRAGVLQHIQLTDEIIDEIVTREYTKSVGDFPNLAIKEKDIASIDSIDGFRSIPLEIRTRNDGSLILLGGQDYEVQKYQSQLNTVAIETDCEVLPQPGDADYEGSPENSIDTDTIESLCAEKSAVWLQKKNCAIEKERADAIKSYTPRAESFDCDGRDD